MCKRRRSVPPIHHREWTLSRHRLWLRRQSTSTNGFPFYWAPTIPSGTVLTTTPSERGGPFIHGFRPVSEGSVSRRPTTLTANQFLKTFRHQTCVCRCWDGTAPDSGKPIYMHVVIRTYIWGNHRCNQAWNPTVQFQGTWERFIVRIRHRFEPFVLGRSQTKSLFCMQGTSSSIGTTELHEWVNERRLRPVLRFRRSSRSSSGREQKQSVKCYFPITGALKPGKKWVRALISERLQRRSFPLSGPWDRGNKLPLWFDTGCSYDTCPRSPACVPCLSTGWDRVMEFAEGHN